MRPVQLVTIARLGRFGASAGARTQFERSLELTQATVGPGHPDVATFRRNLDFVLQQLGGD